MISLINHHSRANRFARNMITSYCQGKYGTTVCFVSRLNHRRFSSDQSRTSGNNVNVTTMLIETTVITVNYQAMCTRNSVPCLLVNTRPSFFPRSIIPSIAYSLPFSARENYPPRRNSPRPPFPILIFLYISM